VLGPRLVVMDEAPLVAEARSLIENQPAAGCTDTLVDLIETILVYKFPKLSRAEIQTMLHLPVTDLKQTRFYQESFARGRQAARRRRNSPWFCAC